MTHPRPHYRLTVGAIDITPDIRPRLISLTLTDNRGLEADTLDLVLDDADGGLALPARGALVEVSLGWAGERLVDKGSFTVDEVEHSGAPDQITIRAKSADLRTGLSTKQERSWHGKTIGELVAAVAHANGLTPKTSAALAGIKIDHIDQTHESDANLLTRVAEDHDAVATVKKGTLLFMPAGESSSVSGMPFQAVKLTRQSGDRHRFSVAERGAYTAVKANYQDVRAATTGEVTADASGTHSDGRKAASVPPIKPSADNTKTLRHQYASKATAERAAKAEWQRLQRAYATFSLDLARGNPGLFPGLPVLVSGFKAEIDGTEWLITRATHNLNGSGLVTSLEMEVR